LTKNTQKLLKKYSKIKNASIFRQHDGDCYTLRKYTVTIEGQVGNAGDPERTELC
jgi:hypothetical protein